MQQMEVFGKVQRLLLELESQQEAEQQEWTSGHSAGVPCGLSTLFTSLFPGPNLNFQNMLDGSVISFACFVIPLYPKQMKNMVLKQIDSS